MTPFKTEGLDHVAIRVSDLEISANWYQKILGLKKYRLQEWGDFPIFLLSGKSGIALFPAHADRSATPKDSNGIKIDHFAFNLTKENFDKARAWYTELNIPSTFQDHHYFHSLYTKDPDGHTVELTTLVVDEEDFYE